MNRRGRSKKEGKRGESGELAEPPWVWKEVTGIPVVIVNRTRPKTISLMTRSPRSRDRSL